MASKPDTWMPFYPGDYLRKTMHLTAEQHGVYMLLIMACWVGGGAIADDDEQLAAITRVATPHWRKLRPKIAPFFQVIDGYWHNKRVTEELTKAVAVRERGRAAGEASAAKRQRNSNQTSTKRQQTPQPNVNQTSTEGPTKRQRKANPSPSPKKEEFINSESVAAREADAEVSGKSLNGDDAGGRFAPLASASPPPIQVRRKELLRQKLMRFAISRFPDAKRSAAIRGLSGGDPKHDDQWWLDTLDRQMRRAKWDDDEARTA